MKPPIDLDMIKGFAFSSYFLTVALKQALLISFHMSLGLFTYGELQLHDHCSPKKCELVLHQSF